MLLKFWFF